MSQRLLFLTSQAWDDSRRGSRALRSTHFQPHSLPSILTNAKSRRSSVEIRRSVRHRPLDRLQTIDIRLFHGKTFFFFKNMFCSYFHTFYGNAIVFCKPTSSFDRRCGIAISIENRWLVKWFSDILHKKYQRWPKENGFFNRKFSTRSIAFFYLILVIEFSNRND